MQDTDTRTKTMMAADCYRYLAGCFYVPNKQTLCNNQFFSSLTSNIRQICPAAAPFSEEMAQSIELYTEEELAVEYAALFVGPFALKAPPYGSIYLDGERTVMGPSTMETIRFYEKEGLVRDKAFTELPDHIAVELEFMYFLSYKEAEALEKGETEQATRYRRRQEEFLGCFLARWVPPFCSGIREGTDNRFYTALADCLMTFIQGQHG